MTNLLELAERVERASGASRELDAEIAAHLCGGTVDRDGRYWKPGVRGFSIADRYTASIDAAVSLLPADTMHLIDFTLSWEPPNPQVWPACTVTWYPPHKSGSDWHALTTTARSAALAITAAALRARAAQMEHNHGE